MSYLQNNWTPLVQVPATGPNNSVAGCLNWYQTAKRNDQQVRFDGQPQYIHSRPTTPYKKRHGGAIVPSTDTAYTFSTDLDDPPISNTPGQYVYVPGPPVPVRGSYTPLPPSQAPVRGYANQNRSADRVTRIPSRSGGRYESEGYHGSHDRMYGYQAGQHLSDEVPRYNTSREEMVREELLQKQIESYERQIQEEKLRLHAEKQRQLENQILAERQLTEYDAAPIRRSLTPTSFQNEKAVFAAVHDRSRVRPPLGMGGNSIRSYAAKPPLPRPPAIRKTGYASGRRPIEDQARYECGGNDVVQHYKSSRPCSGYTGHIPKQEPGYMGNVIDGVVAKRVSFHTPRPSSAYSSREVERVSKMYGPGEDHTWKMSRFTKNARPRIDNRWERSESQAYTRERRSSLSDNKVKVNVECPEGENMDIALSLAKSGDQSIMVY